LTELERKVEKKVYEIPEDELKRLVISKIPRVRLQGEKPKSVGIGLFGSLMLKNCEVCGDFSTTLVQCGYCGRWVSGITPAVNRRFCLKREASHIDCWNKEYGSCKICAEFIKEDSEKSPCPYCGTLSYRFQDQCPHCGATRSARGAK
jgi:hypothetical protein